MPAGNNIPPMLSWTKAKEVCTPQDFERLACALLNSMDVVKFNAETASAEFGCAPESFKSTVWKITNKIKKAKGDGGSAPDADAAAATPAKRGRKRKAEGEGKKGGKKKVVKKDVEKDDLDPDVPIKAENGAGGDHEDEDGDLI